MATSTEVDKYLFVICGTPGYVAPEVANLKDINMKYGNLNTIKIPTISKLKYIKKKI